MAQTSLCFVNCHLAAGGEKLLKRNANVYDIMSKLQVRKWGGGDTTNGSNLARRKKKSVGQAGSGRGGEGQVGNGRRS